MKYLPPVLLLLGMVPTAVRGETLEQVISREDPRFRAAAAIMTVGRDGRVYQTSPGQSPGQVLRLTATGGEKAGAEVAYALGNATANAAGVIATTHGHFAHKVVLYRPDFTVIGEVSDFLVGDAVGYNAPGAVRVGSSGDFYGLDQHRQRILRISPDARVLKAYSYPAELKGPAQVVDFQVDEERETLILAPRGRPVTAVDLDGKVRWTLRADISGGWDLGPDGTLYTVGSRGRVVKKYAAGKDAGTVTLEMGEHAPTAEAPLTALQVHDRQLFLRRRHPAELFQVYDQGGRLVRAVAARHERLAVEIPGLVWTSGQKIPFAISFSSNTGKQARPRWRVWARPFGGTRYRELTWRDGRLEVPEDLAGLYVLKVSPEVQPVQSGDAPEYLVREVIEVRRPGSRGTLNALTPGSRVFYGRGEAIPVRVLARAAEADVPRAVVLRLTDGERAVAEERVVLRNGEAALTIPAALTAALRPGDYSLEAAAGSLTPVAQQLVIGPGMPDRTPCFRVQFGDYGALYPGGTLWDAAETVSAHAHRAAKLGTNLFVDRIGTHIQIGALGWPNTPDGGPGLAALVKRLEADPLGVAPAKTELEPPLLQTMAAYSAAGIRQMAILTYMDAGLPIGTGHDPRKPEQFQAAIKKVTEALLPYPSFRGWSWTANQWVYNNDALFQSPQEKQQYQEALKRAGADGSWSPILGTIADRRFALQVEAQEMFNTTLAEAAPGGRLKTANSGPYRRPGAYPPVVFQNVEEVDLHYQAEQIPPPGWAPHGADYSRRPGKLLWAHPEVRNDDGTGGQILPNALQLAMRGADGVGTAGAIPHWGERPADARSGYHGTPSMFRALFGLLDRHGRWLNALENHDSVAIVVSRRQASFALPGWKGIGSEYFTRQLEAYHSLWRADRPATFVFSDDLERQSLTGFKAVFIVGQTVEMEGELRKELEAARARGVRIYHDGTCRETLVKGATPLGVAFDNVAKDPHVMQDDAARWRFEEYFEGNAARLEEVLGQQVPPVGRAEAPHVLLSERRGGEGRYLFVANNTRPTRHTPGQLWRVTMALTNLLPVQTAVQAPGIAGKAVYDVFAMRRVEPRDGRLTADLRGLPLRIFAVLPRAIGGVDLRGPGELRPGETFAWRAQVRDEAGAALSAPVPVRVCLRDARGEVVEELHLTTGKDVVHGRMTLPLNLADGQVSLEATELFSGRTTRLAIGVSSGTDPVPLGEWRDRGVRQAEAAGVPAKTPLEPAEHSFGPHLRDVTLLDGGKVAVFNAFEWDSSLYAVDTASGKVLWRQKVGDHFAFDPQATANGLAVQGFDFASAEGYHLYLLDGQGRPQRRFALHGLPERLTNWAFAPMLTDRINNFAVAPDGGWVASSGDLGLAIFDRSGKLLWQKSWPHDEREPAALAALDEATLLVVRGGAALAREAASGKEKWRQGLIDGGEVRQIVRSADGKSLALHSTAGGGTVLLLRDGRLTASFQTPVREVALSSEGTLAVATGRQLKVYSPQRGLQWTYRGDDTLHHPRYAPDGRLAAVSALGTLTVLSPMGELLHQRDVGAVAVPVWLADGDLLLGGWTGTVQRLGKGYAPRWVSRLRPAEAAATQAEVPTARVGPDVWSNAAARPAPLAPNLLASEKYLFEVLLGDRAVRLQNDRKVLADGDPSAPPQPWLSWSDVQMIESGWRGETSLVLDFFNRQVRVKGLTFVEDPAHPESWLRAARLQYWDAGADRWRDADLLLSDAARHTHMLKKPLEAGKLRLVKANGYAWPVGNVRLGELVVHGEALGASHPDVVARKPVATLFDDDTAAVRGAYVHGHNPGLAIASGAEAYSGAHYLSLDPRPKETAAPLFYPVFGHQVPTWSFEVVEKPGPGQYRYLQLAWRALSDEASGVGLHVGPLGLHAGKMPPFPAHAARPVKLADTPPREWKVQRIDLWELGGRKPFTIHGISFGGVGGPVAFDRVILGRTEANLPPAK